MGIGSIPTPEDDNEVSKYTADSVIERHDGREWPLMARKAKKKTRAPRKAAVAPIEAGLTIGELVKLN